MTKKLMLTMFVAGCVFLNGCSTPDKIIRGKARGNERENVRAVQNISKLGTVKTVAVLCRKDVVIAGIRLSDRTQGTETCRRTLEILKEQFPTSHTFIVGADELWAENVIELSLCAEGGMDKKVLEKRFGFLVNEKLKNAEK